MNTYYERIQQHPLPVHIAIIMDGNGRWAKKRGKLRAFGHKAGAQTVKQIIKDCNQLGLQCLTLYAFSTENWKRPKDEINTLMSLVVEYLKRETKNLMEENCRMRFIGDISKLPESAYRSARETENILSSNTGLIVNIALNYGGRDDILHAVKSIAADVKDGNLDISAIDEEQLSQRLYTAHCPDPDLLIRTGGEIRLSNFLTWQSIYSELYFCDTLWPDFDKEDLCKAIYYYQTKDRRYGGLNE